MHASAEAVLLVPILALAGVALRARALPFIAAVTGHGPSHEAVEHVVAIRLVAL